MVILVSNVKYACETCIRGHRTSSCSHHNRPLIPIKKKGRPPSQCPTCRQNRLLHKRHVKCRCHKSSDSTPGSQSPRSHSTPTNVTSLASIANSSLSSFPSIKHRLQFVLNCQCSEGGTCLCNQSGDIKEKVELYYNTRNDTNNLQRQKFKVDFVLNCSCRSCEENLTLEHGKNSLESPKRTSTQNCCCVELTSTAITAGGELNCSCCTLQHSPSPGSCQSLQTSSISSPLQLEHSLQGQFPPDFGSNYHITEVNTDSTVTTFAVTAAPGIEISRGKCCCCRENKKNSLPKNGQATIIGGQNELSSHYSSVNSAIFPYMSSTEGCDCGCKEPKEFCSDCVQDGCLEFLLRPPSEDS